MTLRSPDNRQSSKANKKVLDELQSIIDTSSAIMNTSERDKFINRVHQQRILKARELETKQPGRIIKQSEKDELEAIAQLDDRFKDYISPLTARIRQREDSCPTQLSVQEVED